MSILSDRQIRDLCLPPTCRLSRGPGSYYELSNLTQAQIDEKNRGIGELDSRYLTVKPQGIKDPVLEAAIADFKPMIEPFEPKQVREVERNGTEAEHLLLRTYGEEALLSKLGQGVTGIRVDPLLGLQIRHRVISYGLSSYGYDGRCANQFKVFTNVYSAVVDPKNFTDDNYVDMQAGEDGSINIPPNSFALARSLGVLPHPARYPGGVPWQVHVRTNRHCGQRDAA
jgi:deoxycytidine triphosphate deaminase